jgi:phosphatidylglycerophosphatase A
MKKWPPNTLSWQQWVGSVLGVGLLPLAPGTWGAAVGALALLPAWGWSGGQLLPALATVTALATWWGAKVAHDLEPTWGEDPKQFVLDETVGLWVTMLGVAVDGPRLVAAFVLFRVFDIWKPLGIRRLESVPRGWGVMLDDVAAGVAANVVLRVGFLFFEKTA